MYVNSIRVGDFEPVFIVGIGRSGTSLLQSMLNAHPEISFIPETHYFRKYLINNKRKERIENSGPATFANRLIKDIHFSRAEIEPAFFLQPYIEKSEQFKLENSFVRLLTLYSDKKNAQIIGDKDPRNIDFLYELHQYFPKAFLINIIRDPRDVVLSRTKATWSSHRPYWIHALIYNAQYRRGRIKARTLKGNRYIEIKYESLIKDPAKELTSLCNKIKVPYNPQMLNFRESSKELVSNTELSWKKETLGPLLTNNYEKWKKGLSPWQVIVIERINSLTFRIEGYKKSDYRIYRYPLKMISLFFLIPLSNLFPILYNLRIRFFRK